ncbi:MAG: hypothetical protein AB7V27_09105 [Candidatus Binatia bacterium]
MESAGRVWHVRAAALATPLVALALVALVLAASEIAARWGTLRARLPPPSVGSPSRHLELQLAGLDAFARSAGGIDCIFLGNSLVLLGLDPNAFDAAYEARSGTRLRSFNFAVNGITASGVAALARILAEDYRPWLIIYGLTMRDFSRAAEAPAIDAMPWVRYRRGAPSVDGWLVEHSLAYRYFLLYAWHAPSASDHRTVDVATARGFYPVVPATIFDAAQIAQAQGLVSYQLRSGAAEQQLAALTTLFRVRDAGTQLVILEMPVHLDLSHWPADAVTTYQQVMDRVRQSARPSGTPVWAAVGPQQLPEDGWFDLWHMNARGAAAFSRWLAERVAAAAEAGELTHPHDRRAPPRS